MSQIGPLGHRTATHFRVIALAWLLIAVAFGIFAPKVEHALPGAGWEATGSESVHARDLIDKNYEGLGSSGLGGACPTSTRTITETDPATAEHLAAAMELRATDPQQRAFVQAYVATAELDAHLFFPRGHSASSGSGRSGQAPERDRAAEPAHRRWCLNARAGRDARG